MQSINKKNLLSLYVIVRDTINFYRINNNKMMKTFTHFFFHVFLRQRFQSIFMRTGAAQQSQHSEEFPLTRKIDARNSILDTRSFFRSQLVKRKTFTASLTPRCAYYDRAGSKSIRFRTVAPTRCTYANDNGLMKTTAIFMATRGRFRAINACEYRTRVRAGISLPVYKVRCSRKRQLFRSNIVSVPAFLSSLFVDCVYSFFFCTIS